MSAQVFDFDAPLPGLLYWDASFLVHATYPAGRYHQACYAFLERLNSAVMSRLGIESIVTTDDDFMAVNGLALFTSNPQILSPR
jgi:hypothetical protein